MKASSGCVRSKAAPAQRDALQADESGSRSRGFECSSAVRAIKQGRCLPDCANWERKCWRSPSSRFASRALTSRWTRLSRILRSYDWLILTSVNGVDAMWERLTKLGITCKASEAPENRSDRPRYEEGNRKARLRGGCRAGRVRRGVGRARSAPEGEGEARATGSRQSRAGCDSP